MKKSLSFYHAIFRLTLALGCMTILCMGIPLHAQTHSTKDRGQEAQALEEPQGQQSAAAPKTAQTAPLPEAEEPASAPLPFQGFLDRHMDQAPAIELWGYPSKLKARPHRPLPAFLIVLGVLLLFFWGLIFMGAMLANDDVAKVVLLVLAIILSPIAIIGIILIAGGAAAAAGGKGRRRRNSN